MQSISTTCLFPPCPLTVPTPPTYFESVVTLFCPPRVVSLFPPVVNSLEVLFADLRIIIFIQVRQNALRENVYNLCYMVFSPTYFGSEIKDVE